jgi:hypothetical protein
MVKKLKRKNNEVVGPIAIIDTIRYNEEVQFGNISTLETR